MQEFDGTHGPGWQCIVGTDFGSFVTHCSGCFIYFSVGSLSILLFRASAGPEAETNQFPAFEAAKAWYFLLLNSLLFLYLMSSFCELKKHLYKKKPNILKPPIFIFMFQIFFGHGSFVLSPSCTWKWRFWAFGGN